MKFQKDFDMYIGHDKKLKLVVYGSAYHSQKINTLLGRPYDANLTGEDEPIFTIPQDKYSDVLKVLKVGVREGKRIAAELTNLSQD